MNAYRLRCEMLLPVSIREAFDAFEDPRNLSRITPPWLAFRMLTENPKMRKDAIFDYTMKWMGIPLHWRSRITEYEPPFHFVDEMVKGPYKMWKHLHKFRPSEAGTVISDVVEYALPFGEAGRLVHELFVAGQLQEIFSYRQEALYSLVGEAAASQQAPIISGT